MRKKITNQRKGSGSRILIIYTGGTIGMIHDPILGTLKAFNFNKIVTEIPELKKFNYLIDSISFKPVIDYSNMTSIHWDNMVDIIEDNYGNFWVPGPKGIMKVAKQQLNDYAAGKINKIGGRQSIHPSH